MTWTKLSDDFSDDLWTLSSDAFRLHVEALVWSNRKLLDCRIPKDDVRRLSALDDVRRGRALEELVSDTWWRDSGAVWELVHQAMYQRSKVDVIAQQQRNVENGRKGGRPPGRTRGSRNPHGNPHGLSNNPLGNPGGNPDGNPQGQDRTGLGQGGASVLPDDFDSLVMNAEVNGDNDELEDLRAIAAEAGNDLAVQAVVQAQKRSRAVS